MTVYRSRYEGAWDNATLTTMDVDPDDNGVIPCLRVHRFRTGAPEQRYWTLQTLAQIECWWVPVAGQQEGDT